MPVPDRLEERVGEPEIQDVLHRFLAEIVIDTEDRVFGKRAMQRLVAAIAPTRGRAERLLDDDARAVGTAGAQQVLDRRRKRARWNREIKERPASIAERPPDVGEELEGAVVPGHVLQQRREPRERASSTAPRADTLFRTRSISSSRGIGSRPTPTIGTVQLPADDERLQRWKDFLVREIAGDTEDDERVGTLGR
jgi:hypothetical protein